MKIILIGGSGTIGSAIRKELAPRHEVLIVGRTHGDLKCDISSKESLEQLFKQVGAFDAMIIAAGNVHFETLEKMTPKDFKIGLEDKLMGQVQAVLIGQRYIKDRGSFTLTGGILSHDPILSGSSASTVNAALEGFVKAAAIELPRGIRINLISPTVLKESMDQYGPFFRGFVPIEASTVALAYSKSVEGLQTGQIYNVG